MRESLCCSTPPLSYVVATALLVKNSSTSSSRTSNINNYKEKDRLICTNCNISRHTMDRCYKLHGYHLRHRGAQKPSPLNTKSNTSSSSVATPFDLLSSLTAEKCQGLLSMLQFILLKYRLILIHRSLQLMQPEYAMILLILLLPFIVGYLIMVCLHIYALFERCLILLNLFLECLFLWPIKHMLMLNLLMIFD